MLNITLNGVKTKVKPGTLIRAVRGAGVPIPSMCYHPDIASSGGRCRVCVCEVDRKIITPCNAQVREGMEVFTETAEILRLRKAAQDMIPKLQQDPETAFTVVEDTIPLKTSSKYILRRPELCTNCNLCVQMCHEVQGVSAIAAVRQDGATEVTNPIRTFHNVQLPETECISCGQCINVCPTGALVEISEIEAVDRALRDSSQLKIVQFAPAVRVALAEEFGCAPGTRSLTHEMVAAMRRLGVDAVPQNGDDPTPIDPRRHIKVFDTNFTADLTIIEEGYELLERLRRTLTGQRKYGGEHKFETTLPMVTSCSPGWINHCERHYPDLLPHLSSCKSPMEMAGALAKHLYPRMVDTHGDKITSIAVMPCVAKKYEKDRTDFESGAEHIKDVDYVITTREFAQLLKKHNIDPTKLRKEEFDDPFGLASGAGLIFGATGGVMEAAIRTAYEVVTGRAVPFSNLAVVPVRGMEGVKEASIVITGCKEEWAFLEGVELKVAVAHGIRNAEKLMDRIRERKLNNEPIPFHFVEIMACPGGCLGGGGQPKPTNMEIKAARAKLIYSEDADLPLRKSHENPAVQKLYADYLKEPLGHLSHELLHTTYHPVEAEAHSMLKTPEAVAVKAFLLGKTSEYPRYSRRNLTNIFSDVVDTFGCVSDGAIVAIADHIGTSPVDVESVLSHYHFFNREKHGTSGSVVYLCDCASCRAHGARAVRMALLRRNIPFHLTPWMGWCVHGAPAAFVRHMGDPVLHPMLNINPEHDERLDNLDAYQNPKAMHDAAGINVVSMKRFSKPGSGAKDVDPYMSVLENIQLSPEDQRYFSETKQCPVSKKIFGMPPEALIRSLECATLRGCGGAGFPTHFKWTSVRAQPATMPKYVVVNADEGLPSTFKDFYILQQPSTRMRMILGMCAAAHTVGAKKCLIYLRYEYRNLVGAIRKSFQDYRKLNRQLDPDLSLDVVLGGGPYICGEETALFESVEGQLPQARSTRTIYPTQHGLFGQPTLVGNVETFAWVPVIAYHGGERFVDAFGHHAHAGDHAAIAPAASVAHGGVKLFCLSGNIPRATLAEYPLGTSLKRILEECSGVPIDQIAAVEVGGVLEVLTTSEEFDKPMTLDGAPGTLAAGGSLVVYTKDRFDAKQVYQSKAVFANAESCQLCTPCREGTKVLRHRIGDIFDNRISVDEKLRMQELFHAMEITSNCGHGKSCGKLARILLDGVGKK